MASNFNPNSSVSEPPIDLLNSQQEQQQVPQQEQQQVPQQEEQPDPQSEANEEDGEGVVEEKDPEGADDKDEEPEQTEDEDNSNSNSQGNFFEENKSLLTKVYNILKLKFPSLNISLSELLTAAQKHIDMYANNPGHGGGVGVAGDGDELKPEIDLSQFSDDDIDEIVNGFCKIYKTDWEEFLEITTFYLHEEDMTHPGAKCIDFKNKKPDDQLEDIANPINIEKYNNEFAEQNRLRISKLSNAVNYIINLKSDNENDLKKKLVEFCLKDQTAVLDYIEYLLKVYFDKWLLPDGSGDRFPYVINGSDKDTGPRKNNNDVKKEWTEKALPLINNCEDDIKSALEYRRFVKDETGNYLDIDSTDKQTKNKVSKLMKNVVEVYDNNKQATFDLQLYRGGGADSDCQHGKGIHILNQSVAKKLLDNRFNILDKEKGKNNKSIKATLEEYFSCKERYPKAYDANGYRFKDYLHDLGIGVDCSGYVSRALAYIMFKLMIPGHLQIETLGSAYGRVKSNATTLDSDKDIIVQKKEVQDLMFKIVDLTKHIQNYDLEKKITAIIQKDLQATSKEFPKDADTVFNSIKTIISREATRTGNDDINTKVLNLISENQYSSYTEYTKDLKGFIEKNKNILKKNLYTSTTFDDLIKLETEIKKTNNDKQLNKEEKNNKIGELYKKVKEYFIILENDFSDKKDSFSTILSTEKEIKEKCIKAKDDIATYLSNNKFDEYYNSIINSVQSGDMEMTSRGGIGFHIKIITTVNKEENNKFYIDHQSSSWQKNERYGAIEISMAKNTVDKKNLFEYRFVRPKFMKDPKLITYFLNMLKKEGKTI